MITASAEKVLRLIADYAARGPDSIGLSSRSIGRLYEGRTIRSPPYPSVETARVIHGALGSLRSFDLVFIKFSRRYFPTRKGVAYLEVAPDV